MKIIIINTHEILKKGLQFTLLNVLCRFDEFKKA